VRTSALVAAAFLAAALFWSRRSEAAGIDDGNEVFAPNPVPDFDEYYSSDDGDPYMPDNPVVSVGGSESSDNLGAFLYMIQCAEVGQNRVENGTSYQTFYRGSLFGDLSDHPVITGEKSGIRLSDEMCRNAGFGPGCVSTAAGAYQITRPTWNQVRAAGSWGPRLPDFSPESQDEAARRILVLIGALPLIERGDLQGAVSRASSRWASLPGSTARQGGHSYITVAGWFNSALG
jgi:muramidase (phage lysozyme)